MKKLRISKHRITPSIRYT